MPRRTLWLERPGADGVVTDVPAHQLPAGALTRGADAIMPNGLIRQRRGWAYDGTTAVTGGNGIGVMRVPFVLAGVTRTMAVTTPGSVYIHNPSSGGTLVHSAGTPILPRCVYRDELILCVQDGVTPLRRYSGAALTASTAVTATTVASGKATLTATSGTWAATMVPGAYVSLYANSLADPYPPIFFRVLERISSTVLTVEEFRSSAGTNVDHTAVGTGVTFPCVSVYEAGTGSFDAANDEFDGTGTVWTGGDWGDVVAAQDGDGLLSRPTDAAASVNHIWAVTNATTLDLRSSSRSHSDISYAILRRCPFKDAAAHKGSLWGAGVAQHKSRLYVSPVDWNLSFHPGATRPFVGSFSLEAEDYLDFLLDFVDVPAANDADEIVAIMPSDNPLVVCKRKDAFGAYGSWSPGGEAIEVAMLPGGEGAGCIDIRSAWELSIGPVWAGTQGVHAYIGGRVVNLCEGRIAREWQGLVEDFDYGTNDYCTIGEKDGVLVVHLTTAAGTVQRTWHLYPYDDRGKLNPRWLDRVSNFSPRFMFSSKIAGEEDRILAMQDIDQGRVIDYGPALDGSGTARDADGTSPALDIITGSRLAREAGARVDERVLELAVEANLYDTGGSSSTLGGSVLSSQALDSDSTVTTALASMASKNADLVKPYVHDIGVKAGLHQVRLTKTATQTTEVTTEIDRIGITVRASKRAVG